MKSFKSTGLFALLVVGLGVYVFWDFTEQKKADPLDPGQVRLTEFSLDQLKEMRVGDVELSFDESRTCRIFKPVEDSCDTETVSSFVTLLGGLRAREVLKDSDLTPEKREEFGLKKEESLSISWVLVSGEKSEISIGTQNSFDGGYFVQKKDVYLLDKEISQLTNKSLNEFRNKVLWDGPELEGIRSMDVISKSQNQSFSLLKTEEDWGWKEQASFPLDPSKRQSWFDSIRKMKATEVFDVKPAEVSGSPDWSYIFHGDGDYQIDFFEKGDMVFAKDTKSSKFYQFPKQRLGSVLLVKEDLYDSKAPFEFPLEKVVSVELKLAGKSYLFKKADGRWTSEEKKDLFREDQLIDFFHNLKKIEAKKFYSTPPKGLKFDQRLSLKDSSGESLFEMNWFSGKIQLSEKSLRAVKVSNSKWTFGVSMNQIQQLEGIQFFKEGSDEAVDSKITDQD